MSSTDTVTDDMRERWDKQIELIGEMDHKLNDWEREFVDSLEIKRGKGYDITWKQQRKLRQIYEKVAE